MDTITLIPLMVRPNMYMTKLYVKPLSTNPTRRSNTQTIHRQIVDELFECV